MGGSRLRWKRVAVFCGAVTRAETIELCLVGIAVGGLCACSGRLPGTVEMGSLTASAALALLGQGLGRDLWLLAKQRKPGEGTVREEARCLCLESTVGLTGVLAGVVMTVAMATPVVVDMAPWVWPVAGAAVWGAGFAMKDIVIQWSPWKLRRVKDHGSILVRWR